MTSFAPVEVFHIYDPVLNYIGKLHIMSLLRNNTQTLQKMMSSIKQIDKIIVYLMIHIPSFICNINMNAGN